MNEYRLQLCTYREKVLNVNVHQRTHRDGIKIWTPEGEKKAFRDADKQFNCLHTGCNYKSDNSCNFQVSVLTSLTDYILTAYNNRNIARHTKGAAEDPPHTQLLHHLLRYRDPP